MGEIPTLARWMFFAGVGFIVIAGFITLFSRLGIPLGKLPGDIMIQGERASCFIPIASMLLLSLFLTLLLNILIRIFNR